VKLAKFQRTVNFPSLDFSLGQKQGKIHERISDFQGDSLGNSDYDLQCPALSFHGYPPGTFLKIKLLIKLNKQISMSPIHVFFWWHQTLYI
jgi:hypothetical protein